MSPTTHRTRQEALPVSIHRSVRAVVSLVFAVVLPFASLSLPNRQVQAADAPDPAGFANVIERVKPAVFSVRVAYERRTLIEKDPEKQELQGSPSRHQERSSGKQSLQHFSIGRGSGFFISEDGYGVTCKHVVEHASGLEIVMDDGRSHPARLVATDSLTDLALIKVDGKFPFVSLRASQPRVGEWALVVSNPFGLGGTVTAGIVSARGRDIGFGAYDNFLQIDAPVNRGSSGGPVFDAGGNVMGVTAAIFSPTGGSVGIGFAIPSDLALSVTTQLRNNGKVKRGWIGVDVRSLTRSIAENLGLTNSHGALVVMEPQAQAPASIAGIGIGDVIESLDGEPIRTSNDLLRRLAARQPGTLVSLGIAHYGSHRTVSLQVAELPDHESAIR